MTTKVWDVHIRWNDQSTSLLPMAEVKDFNPIELSECSIANFLAGDTEFN